MFSVPFELKCSACGRSASAPGSGVCALCGGIFCGDHLVVKKGVAACEPCTPERQRLETSSGVSAADADRIVALIGADVAATIGPGHHEPVIEAAARHRLHPDNPAGYMDRVVADVQQYFHDAFVDTAWPACPRHPNHPLWFADGWWRCERNEEPIARLGALAGCNE